MEQLASNDGTSSDTSPRWATAALLTIDMQRDFSDPAAPGFVDGTDGVVATISALAEAFRAAHRPVLHALRLYLPDGSNAERCRRETIRSGSGLVIPETHGAALVDSLCLPVSPGVSEALLAKEFVACGPAEWIFYKPRWSAFFGTSLERELHARDVDTLVVAGCNFPNCPSATLFDATERDFRVVLVTDAVSQVPEHGPAWCRGIGGVPLTTREVLAAIRALSCRHESSTSTSTPTANSRSTLGST